MKKNPTPAARLAGNNLTSLADHLDQQYGKRGIAKRNAFEQEFEAFKLGVLIQEWENNKDQHSISFCNSLLHRRHSFFHPIRFSGTF